MRSLIAGILLALCPALASAQSSGFSTRAIKEFESALTAAGYFGFPRTPTASLPACTTRNKGAARYDSTTNTMKFCDGTAWGAFAGAPASAPFSDATALVKNAADATKTVTVDASGITTGNDIDLTFSGTAAAPLMKVGDAHIGHDGTDVLIGGSTSDGIKFRSNDTSVRMFFSLTKLNFSSIGQLGFASAAAPSDVNQDAFFMRDGAAASIQLGADLNGAAIAQTFKSCDGITGTDIAGCDFIHAAGRGTGVGAPGDFKIQTGTPLATGTTAQVLTDRMWVETGYRALTDGVATAIFTVATANDTACGGTVFFTVEAADAANHQSTSGQVNFAVADNATGAGGEACGGAVSGTNATAATSGTLTVTATVTDGGTDVCNVNLVATGSLTETIGPRARYSVVLNPMTSGTCTITPQ